MGPLEINKYSFLFVEGKRNVRVNQQPFNVGRSHLIEIGPILTITGAERETGDKKSTLRLVSQSRKG